MFGMEDPQYSERIDMEQMTDAMMPFFTLAIVLFGIETVFDMFWREHKKAKREREREKKREMRTASMPRCKSGTCARRSARTGSTGCCRWTLPQRICFLSYGMLILL